MKTSILVTGIAAIALIGTAVMAQGGDRAAKMFERVDTNSDGVISSGEAAAAREAMFSRIDANGDGAVTLTELENVGRKNRKDRAAKRFERIDANGDGAVTWVEFDTMASQRFGRMDANGDGTLTRDEIKARKPRKGG